MESPIKEIPIKMFTVQFEPEKKGDPQTLWMFKDGTVVLKIYDGDTITLDKEAWAAWLGVLAVFSYHRQE